MPTVDEPGTPERRATGDGSPDLGTPSGARTPDDAETRVPAAGLLAVVAEIAEAVRAAHRSGVPF